jgi:carbonic anhydrase
MGRITRREALRALGASAGVLAAGTAFGPGLLGDAAFAGVPGAVPGAEPKAPTLTPDQALARLAAGNRRFVSGRLRNPRRDDRRRSALAEGQAPYAAVLGCADSRVPPEIIYDEGLGNLFVARVAGNTTEDAVVAGSLEYSITQLGSVVIVVLGHEQCGAVKAAIDVVTKGAQLPGDLPAVVAPIIPVVNAAVAAGTPNDQLLDVVIKDNVRAAVATLEANPALSPLIGEGKLKVVGREYLLESGKAAPVV